MGETVTLRGTGLAFLFMIRKVQPADVPQITAIYNYYITNSTATFDETPYTEEHMAGIVNEISSRYPYYIYEENGQVAGYCYAHPWKERSAFRYAAESSVYVSPDFTNRGIGRDLMQTVIAECRRMGFHSLIACITVENEPSEAMHRSLGFRQVSMFDEVGFKFGRWLGIVDYELML